MTTPDSFAKQITIEYEMIENSMRFTVPVSDFVGMTAEQIEEEICEMIEGDARANISFVPCDVSKTVREIKKALADEEAERALEEEEPAS